MNDKKKKSFRPPAWLAGLAWALVGFLLALFVLADPFGIHSLDDHLFGDRSGAPSADADDGTLWTCGMHPEVIQNEPGTCPICGMNLTPMKTGETAAPPPAEKAEIWTCPEHPMIEEDAPGTCPIGGRELVRKDAESTEHDGSGDMAAHPEGYEDGTVVTIDPAVVQNMNVRTAVAEVRDLKHRVRSVGYLEYDQARMVTVTTKYSGWIEKVYVNYVGEKVRVGQPLFEVYSPELVQTQEELLSAIRFSERLARNVDSEAVARARGLVDAAERRLRYWDISDEQIDWIRESNEVIRTMTVVAPAAGVVMRRMKGLEGMAVRPGMEAYHIADLSALWVTVEIFEDHASVIGPGTPAKITFASFPGETFHGSVRFIEPEVSEQTRTLRAKVDIKNPDLRLRTGMFATVVFEPTAAESAVAVPALSVLRTGERDLVVIDLGNGRFAPRPVVLGHEHDGWVEIMRGLNAGERVVTSSQFLLDSESSLREAIQKMADASAYDAAAGHQH